MPRVKDDDEDIVTTSSSQEQEEASNDSPWQDEKIVITLDTGNNIDKLAKVLGNLAVYPSLSVADDSEFTLTHVPTSLAFVQGVKVLADVFRIGEYLHSRFPLILRETTKEGLREKMPEWVRPWLKEVAKCGEWVESGKFRK